MPMLLGPAERLASSHEGILMAPRLQDRLSICEPTVARGDLYINDVGGVGTFGLTEDLNSMGRHELIIGSRIDASCCSRGNDPRSVRSTMPLATGRPDLALSVIVGRRKFLVNRGPA